jgi:hypothetical protein
MHSLQEVLMRSIGLVGSFAALAVGAPLAAQSHRFRTGDVQSSSSSTAQSQRGRRSSNIPPGQMPPAGMCRVWIDGVPPGHQPAPTDCQTAVANRPANARILWGDQTALTGNGRMNSRNGRDSQTGENTTIGRNGRNRENDDENDNENTSVRRNGRGRENDDENDNENSSVRRNGRGHENDDENDDDDRNEGNRNSVRPNPWPVMNGGVANTSRGEWFKSKRGKKHGDD